MIASVRACEREREHEHDRERERECECDRGRMRMRNVDMISRACERKLQVRNFRKI